MARWRPVNGAGVPARRLLTEWGTPVHVQRQDEGEWADGANWSERLLDETYGSGYVRALVLRLERGGAAADSKTAVSAPSQCRPWVK
ncbi:hypothetical protein PBV88_04195, partial [Streptomyces sp. T21Q-yed]|nr:hypothetical protein [Streptomyces sp. T21Q-yed]